MNGREPGLHLGRADRNSQDLCTCTLFWPHSRAVHRCRAREAQHCQPGLSQPGSGGCFPVAEVQFLTHTHQISLKSPKSDWQLTSCSPGTALFQYFYFFPPMPHAAGGQRGLLPRPTLQMHSVKGVLGGRGSWWLDGQPRGSATSPVAGTHWG